MRDCKKVSNVARKKDKIIVGDLAETDGKYMESKQNRASRSNE